jgi:cytoskeletal protein CcmA (bactofilin family)
MEGFFGKKKQESDVVVEKEKEKERPSFFKGRDSEDMVDSSKVDTVIGPSTLVKGDVHSKGTLRVDGNVEGNIRSDSTVIIGEKGNVKANVVANHIVVGGTVHGNIHGREKVEVLSTGRLYGDVTTAPAKFIVAEGVIFEGRCTMSQAAEAKPRVQKMSRPGEDGQEPVPAPAAAKASAS